MTDTAVQLIEWIEDYIKETEYKRWFIGTPNPEHKILINTHPDYALFFAPFEDQETILNYFLSKGMKQDTLFTSELYSSIFLYQG